MIRAQIWKGVTQDLLGSGKDGQEAGAAFPGPNAKTDILNRASAKVPSLAPWPTTLYKPSWFLACLPSID